MPATEVTVYTAGKMVELYLTHDATVSSITAHRHGSSIAHSVCVHGMLHGGS